MSWEIAIPFHEPVSSLIVNAKSPLMKLSYDRVDDVNFVILYTFSDLLSLDTEKMTHIGFKAVIITDYVHVALSWICILERITWR